MSRGRPWRAEDLADALYRATTKRVLLVGVDVTEATRVRQDLDARFRDAELYAIGGGEGTAENIEFRNGKIGHGEPMDLNDENGNPLRFDTIVFDYAVTKFMSVDALAEFCAQRVKPTGDVYIPTVRAAEPWYDLTVRVPHMTQKQFDTLIGHEENLKQVGGVLWAAKDTQEAYAKVELPLNGDGAHSLYLQILPGWTTKDYMNLLGLGDLATAYPNLDGPWAERLERLQAVKTLGFYRPVGMITDDAVTHAMERHRFECTRDVTHPLANDAATSMRKDSEQPMRCSRSHLNTLRLTRRAGVPAQDSIAARLRAARAKRERWPFSRHVPDDESPSV